MTEKRHPDSTFEAEYPYNQATISRSGHEFHINDTPGKESLRAAHTSGTYVEIESTGRWVQTVVEKMFSYVKGTFTKTVDSHVDIKIGGTYTFNCDKSSYEAVALNKTSGVGGDLQDGVGGERDIHTEKDKYESVNGSSTSFVKGDVSDAVEGNVTNTIGGVRSESIVGDWQVSSTASVEMVVDGKFRIKCDQFIVDAREILMTATGGVVRIKSDGNNVYVDGVQIRLND
jgi:hypothetical protein